MSIHHWCPRQWWFIANYRMQIVTNPGIEQEADPFCRQRGGTEASLMARYSFANKHFVPIDRGWKARVKIVGFRYDGYLEEAPKMSTSRYRLSCSSVQKTRCDLEDKEGTHAAVAGGERSSAPIINVLRRMIRLHNFGRGIERTKNILSRGHEDSVFFVVGVLPFICSSRPQPVTFRVLPLTLTLISAAARCVKVNKVTENLQRQWFPQCPTAIVHRSQGLLRLFCVIFNRNRSKWRCYCAFVPSWPSLQVRKIW